MQEYKNFRQNLIELTDYAANSMLFGIYIFINSEVLIFFSVFWQYLHSSLSPSMYLSLGYMKDLMPLWHWDILTFYLTLILTVSSIFITWAEFVIILRGTAIEFLLPLSITIILGLLFICMQFIEFMYLPFTVKDGIFSLSFYTLVGLHGFHAIFGVGLLLLVYIQVVQANW